MHNKCHRNLNIPLNKVYYALLLTCTEGFSQSAFKESILNFIYFIAVCSDPVEWL